MSFLSKIGNILGKATDFASNILKPMKNHVASGLRQAGNFLVKNKDTIGTIATGIGNILSNLPNGELKDKLGKYGSAINTVGGIIGGNKSPSNLPIANTQQNRPQNTPRINQPQNTPRINQPQRQPARPQNQQFGTQPTLRPIQQPAFGATTQRNPSLNTRGRRVI